MMNTKKIKHMNLYYVEARTDDKRKHFIIIRNNETAAYNSAKAYCSLRNKRERDNWVIDIRQVHIPQAYYDIVVHNLGDYVDKLADCIKANDTLGIKQAKYDISVTIRSLYIISKYIRRMEVQDNAD